jgi:hypothetical protein
MLESDSPLSTSLAKRVPMASHVAPLSPATVNTWRRNHCDRHAYSPFVDLTRAAVDPIGGVGADGLDGLYDADIGRKWG